MATSVRAAAPNSHWNPCTSRRKGGRDMAHDDRLIVELEERANQLRRDCCTIFASTQMGHGGGTMSIIELVTALYFHHLRFDPQNVDWPERDRLVLSKAHCCEVIYAALVELGVFPREMLETY